MGPNLKGSLYYCVVYDMNDFFFKLKIYSYDKCLSFIYQCYYKWYRSFMLEKELCCAQERVLPPLCAWERALIPLVVNFGR
jgi:hypothetical protein